MGITDFIGGRGEAIAFARLTKPCRADSDLPYFWPHFLGEKGCNRSGASDYAAFEAFPFGVVP
jgi:hypothetical protein